MKKFTIIALLIAAIGLIGPKIIGSDANTNINEAVAAINEAPGYQELTLATTITSSRVFSDPMVLKRSLSISSLIDESFSI